MLAPINIVEEEKISSIALIAGSVTKEVAAQLIKVLRAFNSYHSWEVILNGIRYAASSRSSGLDRALCSISQFPSLTAFTNDFLRPMDELLEPGQGEARIRQIINTLIMLLTDVAGSGPFSMDVYQYKNGF